MKLNSTIAAIVLGLGTASVASATNYIYITGSTAARAAVYNSLVAGVGFDTNATAPYFNPPSVVVTYSSSTPANCSYMEFVGNVNGVSTIIKAHWSGSEAGIADVSGSTSPNFLNDPGVGGVIPNGNSSTTPSGTQLVTPPAGSVNVAMADNSITYSQTPGSNANQQGPAVVVPFTFVKAKSTGIDTSAFTNITSDQFRALALGAKDLAMFIGQNPTQALTGVNVYLTGRDNQSGTRANTFGLTGFGINSAPNQIELVAHQSGTPAANDGTSTMFNFGTAATPVVYYPSTSGQGSGGTLAQSMGDTGNAPDYLEPDGSGGFYAGFVAVTYLGLADEATAVGSPYNATLLTYNGVPYSIANVENGTYADWGNEYVLSRNGSSTAVGFVQSSLALYLQYHTSGAEIPLNAMKVTRSGPTTPPSY